MANPTSAEWTSRLVLVADIAADLMTPNPLSVRGGATIPEIVAYLTDKGISAAPVVDEAGRPVGVVSRTDILVHDRERLGKSPPGGGEEGADQPRARDIMTPAVFAVPPDYPAARVVGDMLRLKVHQLYVVEPGGTLVGVVNSLDVLRNLRPVE